MMSSSIETHYLKAQMSIVSNSLIYLFIYFFVKFATARVTSHGMHAMHFRVIRSINIEWRMQS